MKLRRVDRLACAAAVVTCSVALLVWPVGTWLQGRGDWIDPGTVPDAVYLVAGARDQNRRVQAVVDFVHARARRQKDPDSGSGARDVRLVLVGNDLQSGAWSPEEQATLTKGKWGVKKLRASLRVSSPPGLQADGVRIVIVPGRFSGTDGEMEALSDYLAGEPALSSVVVVTSPYHVRRTLQRLRHHLRSDVQINALSATETPGDRSPLLMLSELGKMLRDSLGLSRSLFLSRRILRYTVVPTGILMWAPAILLLYGWVVYPLLLAGAAAGKRNAGGDAACLPTVAVLLAAYNEEKHIEQRLENLAGLDYETGRIAVHVGVDGATDGTAAAAKEWASRHANTFVHDFKQRRGKVAVLKDLVRGLSPGDRNAGVPEILVLTDANTVFRGDALRRLVAPFSDPAVGGVCGKLLLSSGIENTPSHAAPAGNVPHVSPEGVYWRGENWLKEKESALDSCLGANGAIFALRRELFWNDVPENTVVDDFVLGMKIREKGLRLVYEPAAVAEEEMPRGADEWRRRVRIGAGDYQALLLCGRCLLPRYGRFAWMFFSHKVVRWFTPHLVLLAAAGCWLLLLWETARGRVLDPFAIAGAGLSVVLPVCGLVGRYVRRSGSLWAVVFRACDHFVTMQAALFVGFLRFCRGNLQGHWTRTPRQ